MINCIFIYCNYKSKYVHILKGTCLDFRATILFKKQFQTVNHNMIRKLIFKSKWVIFSKERV